MPQKPLKAALLKLSETTENNKFRRTSSPSSPIHGVLGEFFNPSNIKFSTMEQNDNPYFDPEMPIGRKRKFTRAQMERELALQDWYEAASVLPETANIRSLDALISQVVSTLPLKLESLSVEALAEGWRRAAGDFVANYAELYSIINGIATIHVQQPSLRYQLIQCQRQLLIKLQAEFNTETIRSLKILMR